MVLFHFNYFIENFEKATKLLTTTTKTNIDK